MKTDGLNHGELVEDLLNSNNYEADRIWLIINDETKSINVNSRIIENHLQSGHQFDYKRFAHKIREAGKILRAALDAYKIASINNAE